MKRFLWLCVIVFLFLICLGCGDTFRPVIIPNPPKFPDPRAAHTVVTISDNGDLPGSVMVVDVTGDSDVSEADCQEGSPCIGVAPVHAVQQTATQVLVVNHSIPGVLGDSLSKVSFSGTTISGATTISLPPDSAPNFVAVAPSDTTAYVTLPNYFDPDQNAIVPSVGVVSTGGNSLGTTIPVGNCPGAIAVTPDKNKLYVASNSSFCTPPTPDGGSISAFNTLGHSPRTITGTLNSPPVWLSARSDSQRVFVLESNGTLAVLDTTSTAGPDILTETAISVPGALSMLYDGHLNRLYIPGGSQVAVVDAAQSVPQLLKSVPIPQIPSVPPANASAVAVAALPDGSRAYVVSVAAAPQPSQVSISAVQGDGTTATYSYTLTGGHDVTPGMTIAVSGVDTPAGFDGTFKINSVSGTSCDQQVCTFSAANTTVAAQTSVAGVGSSTIDNLFPQVTVINTPGNTIKTTVGIPGFPDATVLGSPFYVPVCVTTRFRFNMAAGGDSSRIYLASCDGGNVNFIDTANDTYLQRLRAPVSDRPPVDGNQPPPQNPVFMIAGP
jgi:DNA-binding beta-propeller fold protein YncE